MSEFESTIRQWPDVDLAEMLEDPETYEAEVFAIARVEIERRGGPDALVAREHRRIHRVADRTKWTQSFPMPLRARITAWACIVLAAFILLTQVAHPRFLTPTGIIITFISALVILLSIAVKRASLVGIAIFTAVMTLVAGAAGLAMVMAMFGRKPNREPPPTDLLVFLPITVILHLLAAGLVLSCWKDARRIRAYTEIDADAFN